MSVLFILDLYKIDNKEAVVAKRGPRDIQQLKHRISRHLKSNNSSILRVRFNRQALLNRFSYFFGVNGVLPLEHLIPRVIYKDLVNQTLPDWLTDERIMQLGLLKGQAEIMVDSDSLIDKIFRTCSPEIFTDDFLLYIQVSQEQSKAFWDVLIIGEVKQRLVENLQRSFKLNEPLATLFVEHLLKAKTPAEFFTLLAYQQHQELLRKSIGVLPLSSPLPARSLPLELLSLPVISLKEKAAKELPAKNIKALEEICRLVDKEQIEASAIAHLIVAPWPLVLKKLTSLIDGNPNLISDKLKIKLQSFGDRGSNELANKIIDQIKLNHFSPLPDNNKTTTNEVINWSKKYFELLHQQFLSKKPVDETFNLSFSSWLLNQEARVARSGNDWRVFSQRVDEFLTKDYLVVICMVDALSALHQDLLLEKVKSVDHMSVTSETLFAPLPTLTEIGKMALITGTQTCDLPSDQETAIRKIYKNHLPEDESLKFVKSWKPASDHIDEKTRLVVFLENRIDEHLHNCVDYKKHQSDVSAILGQLMRSISSWKTDAAHMNRDVVFLITADHGMTVTQTSYCGVNLGESKERVFKVPNDYTSEHDDFAFVSPGGNNSYLIAKKRMRLTDNALLSHGGVTPEEVLIPFVTLSSRQRDEIKQPLEIALINNKACRLKGRCWQITIELNASVLVENICIKFDAPLIGEEVLQALDGNGSRLLPLNFSSDNEQSGPIEFSLSVSYDIEGVYEVNNKSFSCVLPEPLIDKDETTQGFEDMFN